MLIDTHVLLWFLSDDPKLPLEVRARIESAETVRVSIVSLWEIAIKLSLRKLTIDYSFHELPALLNQLEFAILPISFADTEQLLNLPFHHRDPFDRMLVAQAIANACVLVSGDEQLDAYLVQRSWS